MREVNVFDVLVIIHCQIFSQRLLGNKLKYRQEEKKKERILSNEEIGELELDQMLQVMYQATFF